MHYRGKFICEFLLSGALLLMGWTYISDLYMEFLLSGVRFGIELTDIPIYLRSGQPVGQNVACPDIIAAAALFAASSGRSLRWRFCGMAVAALLTSVLQAAFILLELQLLVRQMSGQEVVALIRDWFGSAMVLMVWFSSRGRLAFLPSEVLQNDAETGPLQSAVPSGHATSMRTRRSKSRKTKKKARKPVHSAPQVRATLWDSVLSFTHLSSFRGAQN